jgi:hypothetical protein
MSPLFCPLHGVTFGGEHRHQLVPGSDETLASFILELGGRGADVVSGLGRLVQDRFTIAAAGGQDLLGPP